MAEEPTLPRFPTVAWISSSHSFNNTRKRARDGAADLTPAQLFANSSDPAMFSSDDDPNLENYTQGGRHRKKRYVGSWFQQQPASGDSAFSEEGRLNRPKGRRTFQRTFDSGVWMGSDASTDLELEDALPEPVASKMPELNVPRPTAAVSAAEERARDVIFHAIENGNEDVDLSNMNIDSLSNATVAPLSELVCIPTVAEGVPFEHRDPALKIYLSQNPLSRAPGALFNLEHLTYLSLRNAKLTELPPAIANLRNLVTLNISLNRFRHLPGELLDLIRYPSKLKTLMIHPNPFHVTAEVIGSLPETHETGCDKSENVRELNERPIDNDTTLKLWLEKQSGQPDEFDCPPFDHYRKWVYRARVIARTPLQFEDSRGAIASSYRLPDESVGRGTAVQTESLAQPLSPPTTGAATGRAQKASRVPSLLELALQSCSRTSQLPYLPSYLPDDAPPHLPDLLRRIAAQAEENANTGDLPCSNCRRRVIIPVAQWLEWWQIYKVTLPQSTELAASAFEGIAPAPFLKRACSYACLPGPMEAGGLLPGTVRYSLVKSEVSGDSVGTTE